jgi:hypothetical protein
MSMRLEQDRLLDGKSARPRRCEPLIIRFVHHRSKRLSVAIGGPFSMRNTAPHRATGGHGARGRLNYRAETGEKRPSAAARAGPQPTARAPTETAGIVATVGRGTWRTPARPARTPEHPE